MQLLRIQQRYSPDCVAGLHKFLSDIGADAAPGTVEELYSYEQLHADAGTKLVALLSLMLLALLETHFTFWLQVFQPRVGTARCVVIASPTVVLTVIPCL